MAKKIVTTTEFIDDIDGGSAAGTVSFSFEGTNYEIDLSKKNKTALEKALKPYVEHARRARAPRRRASSGAASRRQNLPAIRAWARDNGFEVSDRGRISQEISDAFAAAH
ncbi:Lsr2 family protein [uncultured Jatrophihabitans sp.]|uniref:histone-like nucleoid-structuring protein Lsr2 n=1 Tax=uncultured Jatrophihabitans sp. TaxID=1610747 RepID=UPI0035CAB89E